jgi:hypothetical protein
MPNRSESGLNDTGKGAHLAFTQGGSRVETNMAVDGTET